MKNKVNFETSNKVFSEIIGNGKKYKVPKYQRDYSWENEQWEDLWQDILAVHYQKPEEREEHYMGYLVLQKQAVNTFKVIDGQQRLTTLSLLILALLQLLKESTDEKDKERASQIRNSYISTKSLSTLVESYKLELNRNNDVYYRVDLASLSDSPKKRNIKASEHKLRKAKEFYEKELKQLSFNGEQLGEFIENVIAHYLLFTVITVGDDVNAYKVFETLNARGVQLSTPDLLKNQLFSIIDPKAENNELIETQEEKWSRTLENLGKEDFSKFLRCFWNSRHPIVSKNALFKKIKTTYTSLEQAIELLDQLQQTSSIYAALTNADDEQWQGISNSTNKKDIIDCLIALKTFNIVQPLPVLLSAYFAYSETDFARICKWIHAFCIRYQVICQLPSNEVDKFYNQIAISIHKKSQIDEVKLTLQKKLPSNEDFQHTFAQKIFPTAQSTKKVYYLLASLENHINPSNPISLKGIYTIEHILPKRVGDHEHYWREQFGDQLEQYVSRLGNLTLLNQNSNAKADQLSFDEKKKIYNESNLALVKKIVAYQDWNTDTVNDYQKYMAKTAVSVWRID